ncbi:MAG: hypothetical protein LAO06_12705 [Acidobacteriia bacterium]|nr:hypothetical protein [Terriglobia bacterium]
MAVVVLAFGLEVVVVVVVVVFVVSDFAAVCANNGAETRITRMHASQDLIVSLPLYLGAADPVSPLAVSSSQVTAVTRGC